MLSHIRRWSSRLAAVAVVAGLGAVAGAGFVDGGIVICAPASVSGGQPILTTTDYDFSADWYGRSQREPSVVDSIKAEFEH